MSLKNQLSAFPNGVSKMFTNVLSLNNQVLSNWKKCPYVLADKAHPWFEAIFLGKKCSLHAGVYGTLYIAVYHVGFKTYNGLRTSENDALPKIVIANVNLSSLCFCGGMGWGVYQ